MVLLHKQCVVSHIFIPCTNFIHSYLKDYSLCNIYLYQWQPIVRVKKDELHWLNKQLHLNQILLFSHYAHWGQTSLQKISGHLTNYYKSPEAYMERLGNNVFNALWENSPDKVCNILSKIWTGDPVFSAHLLRKIKITPALKSLTAFDWWKYIKSSFHQNRITLFAPTFVGRCWAA